MKVLVIIFFFVNLVMLTIFCRYGVELYHTFGKMTIKKEITMATISEDYVSFEVAKLLKDKGFNEPTIGTYNIESKNPILIERPIRAIHCEAIISAPTLQMAMKWLREVHKVHIEICLYKTNKDDIEPKKSRKAPYYTFGVWDSVTGENVDKRLTNDFVGDTYEQACEAAIKYCIKDLI